VGHCDPPGTVKTIRLPLMSNMVKIPSPEMSTIPLQALLSRGESLMASGKQEPGPVRLHAPCG
jgi:hypothetical protein